MRSFHSLQTAPASPESSGPAVSRACPPPLFRTRAPLVLASASPRRQRFLRDLGLDFQILPSRAEEPEPLPGEDPAAYAEKVARLKAEDVAAAPDLPRNAIILAADTVVALPQAVDSRIMGKPADADHALDMLSALSGRTHLVVTGCALLEPGGGRPAHVFHVATRVSFHPWDRAALAAYARCGEPLDKAGAYAIQGRGSFLVESIEGSYTNVVGLPVAELLERLIAMRAVAPGGTA